MSDKLKKYLIWGSVAAVIIIITITTCKPKNNNDQIDNPTSSEVEKDNKNDSTTDKNNQNDSNSDNSSTQNGTSTSNSGSNSDIAVITPPGNDSNSNSPSSDIPENMPAYGNNVDVMQEQVVPKETESVLFTDLPSDKTCMAVTSYIEKYDYYIQPSHKDFGWNPIDLNPLYEKTGDERYKNLYLYSAAIQMNKDAEFGGVMHKEYEHLVCRAVVRIDENGVLPRYIAVGNVSSPYSGGELILDDGFVDDDMLFEIVNFAR